MENNHSTQPAASKKGRLLALAALVVAVAALLCVYLVTRKPATAGQKTIEVTVVEDGAAAADQTITTDEEYLRGALEQENLIAGTESQYGLFVTTVNGRTAEDAQQEWWCFTKDGATLETGVDTTPIADGDHYEITLTNGY